MIWNWRFKEHLEILLKVNFSVAERSGVFRKNCSIWEDMFDFLCCETIILGPDYRLHEILHSVPFSPDICPFVLFLEKKKTSGGCNLLRKSHACSPIPSSFISHQSLYFLKLLFPVQERMWPGSIFSIKSWRESKKASPCILWLLLWKQLKETASPTSHLSHWYFPLCQKGGQQSWRSPLGKRTFLPLPRDKLPQYGGSFRICTCEIAGASPRFSRMVDQAQEGG